jgi:DNA repair exonuclease SbcCD nuclease subunit
MFGITSVSTFARCWNKPGGIKRLPTLLSYAFITLSKGLRCKWGPGCMYFVTTLMSGHIHRFQVLTKDLQGCPVPTPVFYPGSTERTSFVEKDEPKGYLVLEIEPTDKVAGGILKRWQFHELPARPMNQLEVQAADLTTAQLRSWIKHNLEGLPQDSVVKLKIHGKLSPDLLNVVSANSLRSLVPPTMNVTTSLADLPFRN